MRCPSARDLLWNVLEEDFCDADQLDPIYHSQKRHLQERFEYLQAKLPENNGD